jgi:hypothetical protein
MDIPRISRIDEDKRIEHMPLHIMIDQQHRDSRDEVTHRDLEKGIDIEEDDEE